MINIFYHYKGRLEINGDESEMKALADTVYQSIMNKKGWIKELGGDPTLNYDLVVDPPSGWQYGFPKVCPFEVWLGKEGEGRLAFEVWANSNGYPGELIASEMLNYCGAWLKEKI